MDLVTNYICRRELGKEDGQTQQYTEAVLSLLKDVKVGGIKEGVVRRWGRSLFVSPVFLIPVSLYLCSLSPDLSLPRFIFR